MTFLKNKNRDKRKTTTDNKRKKKGEGGRKGETGRDGRQEGKWLVAGGTDLPPPPPPSSAIHCRQGHGPLPARACPPPCLRGLLPCYYFPPPLQLSLTSSVVHAFLQLPAVLLPACTFPTTSLPPLYTSLPSRGSLIWVVDCSFEGGTEECLLLPAPATTSILLLLFCTKHALLLPLWCLLLHTYVNLYTYSGLCTFHVVLHLLGLPGLGGWRQGMAWLHGALHCAVCEHFLHAWAGPPFP